MRFNATHLKVHRIAASFFKKVDVYERIARTKGGLNSKLHTVVDQDRKPICLLLSEGKMSNYKGAALLLPVLPDAKKPSHLY